MKQIHVRVDDSLYHELNSYLAKTEQTIQDCVREAVAYYVSDIKKRTEKSEKDKSFHFIDLFAGRREV